MFQKTSKTLYYMKIMACKIPPGGGEPFWPLAYISMQNIILFIEYCADKKFSSEQVMAYMFGLSE